MICNICKRYSGDTSQVGLRQFNIHGTIRTFAVCLKPEHEDALQKLTEMVDAEERAILEKQKKIEEEAKKVLAEEEKRKKEYEQKIARETDEKNYKRAIYNFEQLTGFLNKKAMAYIYKMLKEAYEQNKE